MVSPVVAQQCSNSLLPRLYRESYVLRLKTAPSVQQFKSERSGVSSGNRLINCIVLGGFSAPHIGDASYDNEGRSLTVRSIRRAVTFHLDGKRVSVV